MDTKGVTAVAVCRRCEHGVFAILLNGVWTRVEGDSFVFLQMKVERYLGLCQACHAQAGQEFVL